MTNNHETQPGLVRLEADGQIVTSLRSEDEVRKVGSIVAYLGVDYNVSTPSLSTIEAEESTIDSDL